MEEENLKIPDLTQQATLEKYQRYLDYISDFDNGEKAYLLARHLPVLLKRIPELEKKWPFLWSGYQGIIKSAKILGLGQLQPEEIEEIFRTNLIEAVKRLQPDLYDMLERKLVTLIVYSERDGFKAKLRKAIENNQERLGEDNIMVNNERRTPTIANWFLHYRSNLPDEETDKLKLSQYLLQNKDIQNLGFQERDILVKVLNLHLRLGIPSETDQGHEERLTFVDKNGTKYVWTRGFLEKVDITDEMKRDLEIAKKVWAETLGLKMPPVAAPQAKPQITGPAAASTVTQAVRPEPRIVGPSVAKPAAQRLSTEGLKDKISGVMKANESLLKTIQTEERQLIEAAQTDPQKIKETLLAAYQNNQPNKVLASLFALSRLKELAGLLKQTDIQAVFRNDILPVIQKQKPGLVLEKLTQDFTGDTDNPTYLKIFLKFLINRALPGQENNAAFLGSRLESIFRTLGLNEYLGLTFFNINTNQFEWAKVRFDENNNLYLA